MLEFGDKGEGPGEFLHVSSMEFQQENGILWLSLFDPVKKCLTSFKVSDLEKGIAEGQVKKVKEESIRLSELYKVDGGYLATGVFTQGKYAIFDDSLNLQRYEGSFLENAQGIQDSVKHSIANNGNTVFSADGKNFTEVVYMASVLSFCKMEEKHPVKVSDYVIKPLNYKVEDDHILNNEVEGYLSASYGSKHIYALYCGVPESDDIATYGNTVHVFSLDGKLERVLELDHSAFQICINDEESKLYVLSHEPEACIWIYSLQ